MLYSDETMRLALPKIVHAKTIEIKRVELEKYRGSWKIVIFALVIPETDIVVDLGIAESNTRAAISRLFPVIRMLDGCLQTFAHRRLEYVTSLDTENKPMKHINTAMIEKHNDLYPLVDIPLRSMRTFDRMVFAITRVPRSKK